MRDSRGGGEVGLRDLEDEGFVEQDRVEDCYGERRSGSLVVRKL